MKAALAVIALVLLALIVPFFLPHSSPSDGQDINQNLPWQIEIDGLGGSRVFGLEPGRSTLAEVRQRLGQELEVAIIAGPDEVGSLEGYYSQVALGFVMGRLVLTLDLDPEATAAMRERAVRAEHMESTTKKIVLHPDDLARAEQLPVRAFGLIPNANLDADTLRQRFGEPAEQVVMSDKLTHYLYPQQGLDIALDQKGKEILQYVPPRDFEARIRAPLLAAQAKAAAEAAAKQAKEAAKE